MYQESNEADNESRAGPSKRRPNANTKSPNFNHGILCETSPISPKIATKESMRDKPADPTDNFAAVSPSLRKKRRIKVAEARGPNRIVAIKPSISSSQQIQVLKY